VAHVINNTRRLREAAGLTQELLGHRANVSRQTINAIEAGRYKPSIMLALKLAKVFAVPVEYIFELEPGDWDGIE